MPPTIRIGVLELALIVATGAASAAELSGTILSAAGDPVADARVTLVDLRRETNTDPSGRFVLRDVPAGEHLMEVFSLHFGAAVLRVEVVDDGSKIEVELDQQVHSGSVTVTPTGRARGLDEVVAPVDVLTDEELALRRGPTLGDTLSAQPGVSATGYGRGSSRPVIRGLSGDRIRVLENGLDTGDVSSVGPDHATAVEPLSAEQIEVVRGPATLLYGGAAVGGVVNVLDGRVPDRVPSRAVTGTVNLMAGSNSDEFAGSVAVDGGGGALAWHLEAFGRDADDYSSPARRPLEEEHEGEEEEQAYKSGRVDNTSMESHGGAVGLSWVGARGYVGAAFSLMDSNYGVPGQHHHDEDEPPAKVAVSQGDHDQDEVAIRLDLDQRRLDLHGRLERPFGGVDALQLRMGWRDYEHRELEGDEVGTRFTSEFLEARVEALLAPLGRFEGVAGVHWLDRDFTAAGDEAFVQPTTTRRVAAFLYQELPPRPWGVQLGVRVENQDTDTVDPGVDARSFTPLSASAGVTWAIAEDWGLNLTASHFERAPTAEELYSNGPHAATLSYEVGDPELDVERGNGADLTLRAAAERVEGSASVFVTRFSDYIYLADSGEVEDELAVRLFRAEPAELKGFELHGGVELYHGGENHLHLESTYDRVEGELRDTGEPLPRMPPQRLRLGLHYLGEAWNARLEGCWVDEQDEVAPLEEPTPDHTMLNASLGYHFVAVGIAHHVLLRGANLTDVEAFNHVSYLKRQAPLPGRTITLSYRAIF